MLNSWLLIEKENIKIFYSKELLEKINAVYDRDETGAIIILRKDLGRIEERCIVAHELGHHFLSSGNSITTCYSLVSYEDYRIIEKIFRKYKGKYKGYGLIILPK